jgi:hypothetical protein
VGVVVINTIRHFQRIAESAIKEDAKNKWGWKMKIMKIAQT